VSGETVRGCRLPRGMTQEELAGKSRVGLRTIRATSRPAASADHGPAVPARPACQSCGYASAYSWRCRCRPPMGAGGWSVGPPDCTPLVLRLHYRRGIGCLSGYAGWRHVLHARFGSAGRRRPGSRRDPASSRARSPRCCSAGPPGTGRDARRPDLERLAAARIRQPASRRTSAGYAGSLAAVPRERCAPTGSRRHRDTSPFSHAACSSPTPTRRSRPTAGTPPARRPGGSTAPAAS